MAYEIDFLAVGDGERSGDAVAMRVGALTSPQEQTVMVLDGGTKESGEKLVDHIKSYYKTSIVNAVICTHSDADHASGLTEVLENLTVQQLFMHQPWNHVADLEEQLTKASPTDDVRQHFRKSLACARDLEKLAKKKGIPITEPFSDTLSTNSAFVCLGPSKGYYESLLDSFRCADELALEQKPSFLQKVVAEAEKAIKWIAENWSTETLVEPEDNATSAENNSSVILLFRNSGVPRFLFTSDAGVPALTKAAEFAEALKIDLKQASLQVPHHGSKRNVGPKILDRIVGPKLAVQGQSTKTAIISAATDGAPKHPSKRVVNALMRRGAKVIATQGNNIVHFSKDAPARNWSDAVALPFYAQVEE